MTVPPILSRDELLARSQRWAKWLLDGPITFFPVRHHSPACATHLAAWIDAVRPQSIIVEGPSSFNRWLPCLIDEQCRPPIAVLATYRESDQEDGLRHSAFYPLCDYSPEWIAVRRGAAIGAKVQFADAEFGEKVELRIAESEDEQKQSLLGVLLADESQWRHSQFIERIVRRLGCRDFDELWDHLFESRAGSEETDSFIGRLAAYCDLSRIDHHERLGRDGTLAREAVMEAAIRAEWKRLNAPTARGSILVVTGGFHTVALAETFAELTGGVASSTTASKKPKGRKGEKTQAGASEKAGGKSPRGQSAQVQSAGGQSNSWLIRYSYDQLDSLSGYQSGMPSPGFYDALWRATASASGNASGEKQQVGGDSLPRPLRNARRQAIARMISQIARSTRGGSLPHEASVTDSIAAVTMLDQLAGLRGHEVPTRNDMLDAITSCMRKDSFATVDGLDAIIYKLLAGDAIGQVPPSAGQPPIVDDFRFQCERFHLPVTVIEGRQVTLELYRKPAHRQISFLLHQLQFLGVPYAHLLDGPDFALGYHLSKLSEEWQVGWSPSAEARLIEMSSFGETVAGAAEQLLEQEIRKLEKSDAARDAGVAVDRLIATCRMGLQQLAERITQLILVHVAEDSRFASMAGALSKLTLLISAREPLEASRLESLPDLIATCYQRACHLVDGLANIPDDELDGSLDGLCSLRELLAQGDEIQLDRQLFTAALTRLLAATEPYPRSEVAGAAAGILHSLGEMDEAGVCRIIENYLDASVTDVGAACGAVRGLMMTARESFWRMQGLLTKIDQLFNHWEEDRFRVALPHLRLAFSQLSPKEIDLVAERVATLHDVDSIGSLHHPHVTEAELHFGLELDRLMQQSLQEDGL